MSHWCSFNGPFARLARLFGITLLTGVFVTASPAIESRASAAAPTPSVTSNTFVSQFCADCHNHEKKKGDLDLVSIRNRSPAEQPAVWERVVRKLRSRQMPPIGTDRPDEAAYDQIVATVSEALDRQAAAHPNPGRTETWRRLNRTEYQHAIRDLLALDVDASAWLPKDEAGHGFDNVTVGDLSPTLLDRYLSAAQKISRLALGSPLRVPGGETIRIRPDLTQEEQVEGLPPGTRGGALLHHTFPRSGTYEVQVRLARDRNEEVEGLREPHELEVLLDRERIKLFTVEPPRDHKNYEWVDQHLKVRFPVSAGPHQLGLTFLKYPSELLETKRQPYQAHFNLHRHPRLSPAIYQISINGPFDSTEPGESPSRRRILVCRPQPSAEEEACAERILSILARRAFRRPVTKGDLARPLQVFRQARAEGDFESGIESALSSLLVSPEFLFRIEPDPPGVVPGTVYSVSDAALASRISFFLWSSIPDDALLDAAERGELRGAEGRERQVRRMLSDPRSRNLASNFAEQWLYLRNLDSISPDARLFPDFDDNLRQAFREETERLFESVVREDRSVLDLLRAKETFLNERLAKHYGIPHIYGTHFRRVALDETQERGGLLRHGSILTVTSYATRTSPVLRGHWVLANLLGTPPPPPPAIVPALPEGSVSAFLPMRERLTQHRANPACAGCHNLMDPVGFALENYDAIGRWRKAEEGFPIDAVGGLPSGHPLVGVAGLERGLLERPELFVGTLTEKLLTFALGRGIESFDAPTIRQVIREAQTKDYRFSAIVLGVVNSVPFTMRKSL